MVIEAKSRRNKSMKLIKFRTGAVTFASLAHDLVAVALVGTLTLATACNDKSSPSSASQTLIPPKMKMTTPIPPSITTPDSVDTRIGTLKFFDGFPDDSTVQKVYDNLDFMRGAEAFLTAMPGASAEALREGFASDDGTLEAVATDVVWGEQS
jgi:hypothetical protein